jgi:branched-chain amino acid transport system permease protein
MQVLNALLNGLAQGAMIALVALGYTMVYGILKLINFAHSEVFMVGAYAGFYALTLGLAGQPALIAFPLGLVASMLVATATGIFVERIAYRPILSRGGSGKAVGSRITPLVTALGMSVLLQNLAVLVFDARPKSYPRILPNTQLIIFVTALVVMGLLHFLVNYTWLGKAMRALSTNVEAARLMGIRTDRVILFTFAIGSSLAALGAVLYCFDQSQALPTMGQTIGTRAFVAAVLGGIGSIPGAVLGGLLLGVVGEITKLTSYSGGQDVLTFLVLIAVLLWRPTGLLGKNSVEKVLSRASRERWAARPHPGSPPFPRSARGGAPSTPLPGRGPRRTTVSARYLRVPPCRHHAEQVMRVDAIMSRRVHTLTPSQTLREAAQMLTKHDVSGAPVLDEDSKVLGFLTRTDLVEALARHGEVSSLRVEDAMCNEVVSVTPEASLEEALKTMVYEGVHRLVVLSREGEMVGILSGLDAFRALTQIER